MAIVHYRGIMCKKYSKRKTVAIVQIEAVRLEELLPGDMTTETQIAYVKQQLSRIFQVGESSKIDDDHGVEQHTMELEPRESDSPTRRSLLNIFATLCRHQRSKNVPPRHRATVSFYSDYLFDGRIIPAHEKMPVSAVYFGNMDTQRNTFSSHAEISYSNKDIHAKGFVANFEYDRNNINVLFRNDETLRKNEDGKNYMDRFVAEYQICLEIATIQKVFVDVDHCVLVFETSSPPYVKKRHLLEEKSRLNRFRRTVIIRRGSSDSPHDWFHEKALVEGNFFAIKLTKEGNSNSLFEVISRLRMRTKKVIEFAAIEIIQQRWMCELNGKSHDKLYASWCPPDVYFLEPRAPLGFLDGDGQFWQFLEEFSPDPRKRFEVTYMIESMFTVGGSQTRDQLLIDPRAWSLFLNVIINVKESFSQNEGVEVVLCGLNRIVDMLCDRKHVGFISRRFFEECEKLRGKPLPYALSKSETDGGYVRILRVVVTPTRMMNLPPETTMSNRILRAKKEDPFYFIRVTFRDDDNSPLFINKASRQLIRQTVENNIVKPITVACQNYGYIGHSNSQIRDGGAYFVKIEQGEDMNKKAIVYREDMGRFEDMTVHKTMSRIGQFFTSARPSKVKLREEHYGRTFDIIGGNKLIKTKGAEAEMLARESEPYTFSDGVGIISAAFAEEIFGPECLNVAEVGRIETGVRPNELLPSFLQFRFRGMKGTVGVDPLLDEIREWVRIEGIHMPDTRREHKFVAPDKFHIKFLRRECQDKFKSKSYEDCPFDIVKYSGPRPVALNRQCIQILEQVSYKQSISSHRRICSRIEQLLDLQLTNIVQSCISEQRAIDKIRDLPFRVDIGKLTSDYWRISILTEPFFRSLIKAAIKYEIVKQLKKEQIKIPGHLGRSMLGGVDETGRLQYGQVFVQYSKSDHRPARDLKQATVLTGKVLLTKNPMLCPGDVRMLEAVDIPELRHFVDVILFSQHGPRPQPDEMAGSDLDGDEYSVMWDKNLFLDRNEQPHNFSRANDSDGKSEIMYDREIFQKQAAGCIAEYIMQDQIGRLSNSHLFNGDMQPDGIFSSVCHGLVTKISQALDFPKTGRPPDPMTTKPAYRLIDKGNNETYELCEAEQVERYPDFHMNNTFMPIYRSIRLNGSLYRDIRKVEEALMISEEDGNKDPLLKDDLFKLPASLEYKRAAEKFVNSYNARLKTILTSFGIETEAELFTGCICKTRNGITEKDYYDQSFYNSTLMIEEKMNCLWKEFREKLFEDFGGYKKCTDTIHDKYENDATRRVCVSNNPDLIAFASAIYRTAYRIAEKNPDDRLLSGAWIAHDVLIKVRQKALLDMSEEDRVEVLDRITSVVPPVIQMLENHISSYCERHEKGLDEFRTVCSEFPALKQYTEHYRGLDRVLYVASEWLDHSGASVAELRREHLSMLLIQFSVTGYSPVIGCAQRAFVELNLSDVGMNPEPCNLDRPGHVLLSFFGYMASREFKNLKIISFLSLGVSKAFLRGEWMPVYEAALSTYYSIIFSCRFDDLPVDVDYLPLDVLHLGGVEAHGRNVVEHDPFVIELPPDCVGERLIAVQYRLQERSGMDQVLLRRSTNRNTHVLVSCRGTRLALSALRDLVSANLGNTFKTPRRMLIHRSRCDIEDEDDVDEHEQQEEQQEELDESYWSKMIPAMIEKSIMDTDMA